MKKLMLIMLLGMFLISFASAWDWDNTKTETGIHPVTGLPTLEIKNAFGLGETLFEGAVTEHTKQCGINCDSKLEFNHKGGVLIDDIRFLTQTENDWIEQDVRSYKFKYEGEVQDYTTVCTDLPEVYSPENNTYYIPQSCEQVEDGTHTAWLNYNIGEELPEGFYEMFLEAKKKPSRTVDWQIKLHGKWLEEWAVWGNISLGDDAEVILNSPTDDSTSLTSSVTFNASANVTNGAFLTNMTPCYNISGTFACNNSETIEISGGTGGFNYTDGSLVAYYPLNETTGTVRDVSMTGYDGQVNNAFNFDGVKNEVTLPNLGISGSQNRAVSVWFKTTTENKGIVSWGTATPNDNFLVKILDSDTVFISINSDQIYADTVLTPLDGEWHHLVVTLDGTTTNDVDIYLDNTDLTEYGQNGNTITTTDNYYSIGSRGADSSQIFNGSIDEVMIYDESITSTIVGTLYNSGNGKSYSDLTAGEKTNLVSYYSLNEVGSDPLDSHGSNDGELSGGEETGTITRGITGKIENAFDFLGTGAVDTNFNLDTSDTYTLNLWAKTTYASSATLASTFPAGASDGTRFQISSDGKPTAEALTATTAIDDGDWHMVTFQYDGTNLLIWVDGNNEVNSSASPTTPSNDLGIGQSLGAAAASNKWYDDLDDVGAWNRALTPTEISELYNEGNGLGYNSEGGGSTSSTQTWNKIISDTTIWNVQTCDTDGDCGFATTNFTVFLDAIAPTITVESPTGLYDYSYANSSLDVNVTFTDSNLEECWYNYNGTNISLEGCLTGAKNSTSIILEEGNYNITFYANDSVSNLQTENINWSYKIFETETTVENQSYETASETFSINVTANASLTDVDLVYNGTIHDTTKSGTTYSKTFDIPVGDLGNNPVRWKFTYGAETIYSDYSYQQVNETVFTICNATYTDDFLNISFKDEATFNPINASIPLANFVYYLGSGTETKTYQYINTTNNLNYEFCGTPDININVEPYVQYKQGTEYPQRIWDSEAITLNGTVTAATLYLLNSVDGLYVTFQIINQAEQAIQDVLSTAIRTIQSVDVVVGIGLTDAAGSVTFWLNPDFIHDFAFSKAGYETYETSLQPTQPTYTLTIGGGIPSETDCTRGIKYSTSPQGNFVDRNTDYDFEYTISSNYWDLDSFEASLYYGNSTLIDSEIKTTNGGTITFQDINTTNETSLYMDYNYSINGTTCFSTSQTWVTQSTAGREFSLWHFFEDVDLYLDANLLGAMGESGTDTFTKSLLACIILVMTIGILTSRYGLQSEAAIMGIVFGIVLLMDYGLGFIPTIQIGNLIAIDYFVSFISFLILIGYVVKEERY